MQLRNYQKDCIKNILNAVKQNKRRLLAVLATGLGKAQPYHSFVLTRSGWKKFIDLKVGWDIYGSDGKLHKIEGIYPQGEMDVFIVNFSDRTRVECTKNHLWSVWVGGMNKEFKTYELSEIDKLLKTGKDIFLPQYKPIDFKEDEKYSEFNFYDIGIFYYEQSQFDTCERIMKEYIYRLGIENRIKLLNGIFDKGGIVENVNGINRCIFRTKSIAFGYSVMELVNSLGGYCTVSFFKRKENKEIVLNVICGNINPFKENKDNYDKYEKIDNYYKNKTKRILSIEYVRREECVCIKTSAEDSLYLTDNFTLTHNTVIFSHLPQYVKNSGKKTLILAHREELISQAKEKLESINPELKVGIEMASQTADDDCDVVIASVPTLGRENSTRIKKLDPDTFGLVIVDESHHIMATSYLNILSYFGANKSDSLTFKEKHPILLGVTATPNRADKKGLEKVFDEVVYKYDLRDGIKNGWLAPIKAYTVQTQTDISNVSIRAGDYAENELADTINNPIRNALIVKTYIEQCNREPTLVFCANVAHAEEVMRCFDKQGVPTDVVLGSTEKERRKEIIELFKKKKIKVLVSVGTLTEGFDAPETRNILMARPTKSVGLFIQMTGRGTRICEGKKFMRLFDFVDNSSTAVGVLSLLGLEDDRRITARGHDIFSLEDKIKELNSHLSNQHKNIDIDLDNIDSMITEFDILKAICFDEKVIKHSRYSWIKIGEDKYKISLGNNSDDSGNYNLSAEIERNTLDKWEVYFYRVDKVKPDFKNGYKSSIYTLLNMLQVDSDEEALKKADEYIDANFSNKGGLISQNARWRGDEATEKQKQLLVKFGFDETRVNTLSKGQANILLAKYFASND